jgi:DegV family protein with EDD domain
MITTPAPLVEMDGRNLYYTFIAGARKVIEHQIELNRINVFPVNDGDTGTNLASTIRSVMESIHPDRSYKVTADRIAEATLINARGNSGIIFAQFFYGLSVETGDFRVISLRQFAESVQKSVRYIYEAVANPVEGTMLTVIREWAEYIYRSWDKFTDFYHMLLSSYEILKEALLRTTSELKVLARNNVVDAGAKGFVLFVEGIIEFIKNRNVKELINSKKETASIFRLEETIPEKVTFRYCTEAIIKDCSVAKGSLKKTLAEFGDSIVIAGSDKIRRIHIHTNNPAELFSDLRKTGVLTYQKADDMVRQSDVVYNRKWKIALVTDSTCDLNPELIENYQINMLPININFGENHYLDKITIQPEQFYKLLDERVDYPKTSQVNEKSFLSLFSHLASHYDSIIAIHLSEKLSGTFYSSQKAAKTISRELGKPITVLNSKSASGGLGLIALRVAQAIESGIPHDEVVRMADKWISNTHLFISVSTLEYLIKGGRLSATKGWIARMFNINPIISIDETGKVEMIDKAFNQRSNKEKVMGHIRKMSRDRKIWNYIILHANNSEAADWYSRKMKESVGKEALSVINISPVLGAHAGIGASAVALLYE